MEALAGEDAGEVVAQPLVLAEEEADLPAAHADVPGGHVAVGADVAVELGHEGLAEPHHLPVAAALGVEVGAALGPAQGQAGEAVLEDLLKAQELDDGRVHRRVEPQPALIGADGGAELHPVAPVHMDPAPVVLPGDPEGHHPLRLHQPLHDAVGLQLRVALHIGLQGLEHLQHRLEELRLPPVALRRALVDLLQIPVAQHVLPPFVFILNTFVFNMETVYHNRSPRRNGQIAQKIHGIQENLCIALCNSCPTIRPSAPLAGNILQT